MSVLPRYRMWTNNTSANRLRTMDILSPSIQLFFILHNVLLLLFRLCARVEFAFVYQKWEGEGERESCVSTWELRKLSKNYVFNIQIWLIFMSHGVNMMFLRPHKISNATFNAIARKSESICAHSVQCTLCIVHRQHFEGGWTDSVIGTH